MIENVLNRLSTSLLIPADQLTAALCLLLSFPFAFLFHFVVFSGWTRCSKLINALAIGPTYFFMWVCFYVTRGGDDNHRLSGFAWDLFSIHLPVLFVYFSLKYSTFMRSRPTLVFAFLLAQLSYHHLSRQFHFYNQYTVNVTGPLMLLIIKLSSFAYDVYDKKISVEKVKFTSFMAWCLLFAGFFTGPVVMYSDFNEFCTNPRLFVKPKPKSKIEIDDGHDGKKDSAAVSTFDRNALKGRKRRATFLILSACLLLIFGLLLQPHFPTQKLLQVSESRDASLLYKIVFLHLSLVNWRLKYYIAWMLAEGALVIIGLGSIVKDGKIKWYFIILFYYNVLLLYFTIIFYYIILLYFF